MAEDFNAIFHSDISSSEHGTKIQTTQFLHEMEDFHFFRMDARTRKKTTDVVQKNQQSNVFLSWPYSYKSSYFYFHIPYKDNYFYHALVQTSVGQIRERTHSTVKGNMQDSEESLIQYYALCEEQLATCFPLDDEVPPYPLPQNHIRQEESRSSSSNTFSPLTSFLHLSHQRCLLHTNRLKDLLPITLKLVFRIYTL